MKTVISKCELKGALFMMESLLYSSSSDLAVVMQSIITPIWAEMKFYREPMLLAPKTLAQNLSKLSKISISLGFSLFSNSIC